MISIIIPTHHRAESLELLLQSLKQEMSGADVRPLEILVTVDGYDKASIELLSTYTQILPLQYIVHEQAQGAASARNSAVLRARGDTFVFLDDDVVVREGWLLELEKLLSDTSTDIWSGAVRYMNDFYTGAYPDRIVQNNNGAFPLGAHLIVRRAVFVPFDPVFALLHNEDTAFVLQCLAEGACLSSAPHLVVYHLASWWADPWAVIRAAKHMQAIPSLMRLYPQHFGRLPVARFGRLLFPKEFALLLLFPLLFFPILFQYLYRRGCRERFRASLPYFFAKWPCALLMRRLYLWKSAWKNRVFVV